MRFWLGFFSAVLTSFVLGQLFVMYGPARSTILGFAPLGGLVAIAWLGPGQARTGWALGWLTTSLLLIGATANVGCFLGDLASGRRWGCGNALRAEMALAQFYFFMAGSGIVSLLRVLRAHVHPPATFPPPDSTLP